MDTSSVTYQNPAPVKASEFPDWLLSHGVPSVTTEEAARLMAIPEGQVRQRFARARQKGRMVSPARGLWVPVPAERALWGAPEPPAYLDRLMRFLGVGYYVGWLSAAAMHGASHQAPQEYQVAVDRNLADRKVGRSELRFYTRATVGKVPAKKMSASTGTVAVSTRGATMLDVMEDLGISGGLDNAATVVVELAEDGGFMDDVLACADVHSASAVRRLGWVLEAFCDGEFPLGGLREVALGGAAYPSLLSPSDKRSGKVDVRWNIDVNREVKVEA